MLDVGVSLCMMIDGFTIYVCWACCSRSVNCGLKTGSDKLFPDNFSVALQWELAQSLGISATSKKLHKDFIGLVGQGPW